MLIKPTPEETRRTTRFILVGFALVLLVVGLCLWLTMPSIYGVPLLSPVEVPSINTDHTGYTFPQVCRPVMPEDLDSWGAEH